MLIPFQLSSDLSTIVALAPTLSSLAVIIGAIFVFFQLRQNNKLIEATTQQAEAALAQSQLTENQLRQNNELANMDMVMRLYEFANTAEVQNSWVTVLHSEVNTTQDWQNLSTKDQVSFYQIAALFESLGVLVQRKLVQLDVIDDMFQIELAWEKLRHFTQAIRDRFGQESSYVGFEYLYKKTSELHTHST
jgi:hypothetical protein